MAASKEQIIELLTTAYNMEIETVTNYLAASVNLDGVRAEEIKKSLAADVTGELGHAQQLGARIKQLGGLVPGSQKLKFTQTSLQPSSSTTDMVGVIKAVIEAEESAIAHYKKVIKETDGEDYVTQDLAIQLLADEEAHVVLFRGFLKEYAQS